MKERLKIVLSPKFYVLSSFLQTTKNKKQRTKLGFTLIELSVVMVIVAMLLSFSLTAFTSVHDSQAAKLNREKIQMVQDAIEVYLEEYGHLPCVADRSLIPIDPNFGISFTTISNDTCTGGASLPAHKQITTAGDSVWIGGVPVRDLGIPENLAYDAYGNRFTYVVSEGLTDPATYDATNSEIEVNNAAGQHVNSSGTLAYTLISHGKSGAGAYKHKTGKIGRACNLTTEDSKNCDNADVEFIDIAPNIGTVIANFFDDTIVWKVNADAVVVPIVPVCLAPWNEGEIKFTGNTYDGKQVKSNYNATQECINDFGEGAYFMSDQSSMNPCLTVPADGKGWIFSTDATYKAHIPWFNDQWIFTNCFSWTSVGDDDSDAFVFIYASGKGDMSTERCNSKRSITCIVPTP